MKSVRNMMMVFMLSILSAPTYAAPPLPPPPDNAALLYYQVFLVIKAPQGEDEKKWDLVSDYAMGKIPSSPAIRDFVKSQTIAKSYALKASGMEKCDWGNDYSQGYQMILPYLGPLRNVARLLIADAKLSAEAGDFKTAAERCIDIFKISRHATTNSTLIGYLVSLAINTMDQNCLKDILVKMPKDAATLDRIKSQLLEVQKNRPSLKTLMEYDFYLGWMKLKLDDTLLSSIGDDGNDTWKKRIKPHVGAADEQAFIAQNKVTAENYSQSLSAVIDSNQTYAQKFAAMTELYQQLQNKGKTSDQAILAAYLLPSFTNILTKLVRDQAGFAALETAIDVYQEQVKIGHLPEALPKGTPMDPFSGKPFLYEKKGDRFTLRCREQDLNKHEVMTFEF